MASRIMPEGVDLSPYNIKIGRCLKMFGLGNHTIRLHRLEDFNLSDEMIAPIIARGNRFDKVKAKW